MAQGSGPFWGVQGLGFKFGAYGLGLYSSGFKGKPESLNPESQSAARKRNTHRPQMMKF